MVTVWWKWILILVFSSQVWEKEWLIKEKAFLSFLPLGGFSQPFSLIIPGRDPAVAEHSSEKAAEKILAATPGAEDLTGTVAPMLLQGSLEQTALHQMIM